jgi:AbrB family looped-hinge helix DNA binding protein
LEVVKLSPKFQVVIPKSIREQLDLHSGQQLQMYILEGSIRIHPRRSVRDLDGSVPDMKWKDILRERDHRF